MNSESNSLPPQEQTAGVSFLRFLRFLGLIEGTSTLVLFGIAMPLKYWAEMPKAVRIVGSVHGLLFVGLALALIVGVKRVPYSSRVALVGIFAAIVPFGPFVFDRWLMNRLDEKPE